MEFNLTCLDDESFVAHAFPGFCWPTVVVPGDFSADVVGGFHELTLTINDARWVTQVRVVWYAGPAVAPPFASGVGLALTVTPPDLMIYWRSICQRQTPRTGLALLQSGSGGQHDRFPLPS